MKPNDKQFLAARLKSAIATAAIVGTLGGWAAFGMQATTVASTDTLAPAAVAQVADASTTASQGTTASQSTTRQSRYTPITSTRSSR